MNATSHVQFGWPRLERRQGNHRSLAVGRRHTWRGAGIQAVAVHGSSQQRGQGAAGGLAGCSLGIYYQGHRTRAERSVQCGWVRGPHRDGSWVGRQERRPGAGWRRSAADERDSARPPAFALGPPRLFLPQKFRGTSLYRPSVTQVVCFWVARNPSTAGWATG